jgi:hypothetical protein
MRRTSIETLSNPRGSPRSSFAKRRPHRPLTYFALEARQADRLAMRSLMPLRLRASAIAEPKDTIAAP